MGEFVGRIIICCGIEKKIWPLLKILKKESLKQCLGLEGLHAKCHYKTKYRPKHTILHVDTCWNASVKREAKLSDFTGTWIEIKTGKSLRKTCMKTEKGLKLGGLIKQ